MPRSDAPSDSPRKTRARSARKSGEDKRERGEDGTYTSKLRPEMCERMRSSLLSGAPIHISAAYVGISRETLYQWLHRGRAILATPGLGANDPEEALFAWFADSVDGGVAAWEVGNNALIAQAAREGVWQAAAWQLERRKPEEYGRRVRVDGVDGADPKFGRLADELRKRGFDIGLLTDAEVAVLIPLMEKMAGQVPDETPPPGVIEQKPRARTRAIPAAAT